MRLSTFSVAHSLGPDHDVEVIDAIVERSLMADEGGFACVYLPEHHFTSYAPYSSNFMLASYLAPQFRQAHLGLSVAVVGLHHPARLAEQANLLDVLTRGRFVMGLGSGGIHAEAYGFGFEAQEMGPQFDRNIDAVEQLWAKAPDDPPVEFDTGAYKGVLHQRIMPAPYRRRRPILKLATFKPDRLLEAARRGWAVFTFPPAMATYRAALAEAGHPDEVVADCLRWSAIGGAIHVAETDAQAYEEVRVANASRAAARRHSYHGFGYPQPWPPDPNRPPLPPRVDDDSPEGIATVIHGSPETVVARLRQLEEESGAQEAVYEIDWGFNDKTRSETIKRSLQLLIDEVVPHFSTSTPEGSPT